MEVLQALFWEVLSFLRVSQAWEILQAGNFSALATADGLRAFIIPIIPLLLIFESILGVIYKKPQAKVYKVVFLTYVFNRFVGRFIAIGMVLVCIGLLHQFAPFQTTLTWYWSLYAYLVWEFGHFIWLIRCACCGVCTLPITPLKR